MQRVLSTVVLLGLLVATAAAFAITEHLKLIKNEIAGAVVTQAFSPVCHCSTARASIRIHLRHSDRVTVTIVDSSRHTVATLAKDRREPKGKVTFFWDGSTDAHGVVSSGTYQPQVKLARRTILLPNKIVVDTTAPQVLSASAGKGVLVPGPKRSIAIQYALSEDAHPVVFLGGQRIILGRRTRTHSVIKWNGRRQGTPLRPGRYVLEVGALDAAGNVTPPRGRKRVVVRLRDVVLAKPEVHVRAGAHFSIGVDSASGTYRWRLGGRHGTAHGKVLHLQAPSRHGRYTLVVLGESHQRATAAVIVRRK